jgi:hypothetical protein
MRESISRSTLSWRFSSPCSNEMGFVDLSLSPLMPLLPDPCAPERRRVQSELGVRHSFREAAQLLSTLRTCSLTNHATLRNRTHRVAAEIEAKAPETPRDASALNDDIVVMIDGPHIRAAPGYQSRHAGRTLTVMRDGEPALPTWCARQLVSLCATFSIGFICPCACGRSNKSWRVSPRASSGILSLFGQRSRRSSVSAIYSATAAQTTRIRRSFC